MTTALEASDAIAAAGSTGRRVTLDSLKGLVANADFWRPSSSPTTTVCAITTHSGYTVVGSSGCADPANFSAAKGAHFAHEDALRKLWPLEGYRLNMEVAAGK